MSKQDLVFQIRQAYISHIKWRSTAKALHMGLPILDKKVALSPDDCLFGQWLNNNGQALSHLEVFQKIDQLHQRIHRIYQTIYKLDTQQKKKIALIRIKLEDELVAKKQILAYFKDMEKFSKELLYHLKELENTVKNLPDNYFVSKQF